MARQAVPVLYIGGAVDFGDHLTEDIFQDRTLQKGFGMKGKSKPRVRPIDYHLPFAL